MRTVVKFGGTSIKNEARIKLAAKNLTKLVKSGKQVITVVSAQGNTTTRLIQTVEKITDGQLASKSYLEYLAMGEKMSCHLLTLALEKYGIKAVAITQDMKEFPLVSLLPSQEATTTSTKKTNEFKHFVLDEEAIRNKMERYIKPLLEQGVVPVIAGFFIVDAKRNLISLGRGGSDITSFLIGKYLNCDEVIIVTDVAGVFSSDPRQVSKAAVIDQISADDLVLLSQTGAQVLHPNALRFKTDTFQAKIVHFKKLGNYIEAGTTIKGTVNTKIQAHKKKLTLFTFTGKNLSEKTKLFFSLLEWLVAKNLFIHSLSTGTSFISLYLEGDIQDFVYQELHEEFIRKKKFFTGLAKLTDVGEIKISNHLFVESPGMISMISSILFREGINIIEMITAHTDIVVYVKSEQIRKSVKILEQKLLSTNQK